MKRAQEREYAIKHLGIDKVKQGESESVEAERKHYSNGQLWERITSLVIELFSVREKIPYAYRLAHCDTSNEQRSYWNKKWESILVARDSAEELIEVYAWHLEKRGDESIPDFMAEMANEWLKCERKWLFEAYEVSEAEAARLVRAT